MHTNLLYCSLSYHPLSLPHTCTLSLPDFLFRGAGGKEKSSVSTQAHTLFHTF